MQGKLERLQNLLCHQVPNGDLAIILERAADLLLKQVLKARFAQKTRKTKAGADTLNRDPGRANSHANAVQGSNTWSEGTASLDGTSSVTGSHNSQDDRGQGSNTRSEHTCGERPLTFSVMHTKRFARAADEPRGDSNNEQSTRVNSRYVPRAVVREVYARDGEQCTFVSADGRRCAERSLLEFHHHDTPYARGGAATAANLRMICRAHNGLLAERDFGRRFMQSKLARAELRKRERNSELVPEREQG
jgi:hypothetical protein